MIIFGVTQGIAWTSQTSVSDPTTYHSWHSWAPGISFDHSIWGYLRRASRYYHSHRCRDDPLIVNFVILTNTVVSYFYLLLLRQYTKMFQVLVRAWYRYLYIWWLGSYYKRPNFGVGVLYSVITSFLWLSSFVSFETLSHNRRRVYPVCAWRSPVS